MTASVLWVKVACEVYPKCDEFHPCNEGGIEGPCWTHDQIGIGLSNAYHEGERRGRNDVANLIERRYHVLVAQKTKARDFMDEFFLLVKAVRGMEL